MSERPSTFLESLDAAGNGVRVEFCWAGDRYRHTIFGVHGGVEFPLLVSDDSDVAAPPLADLQRHGDVLLLTGANSAGHWSLSVQRADGRDGIAFDFACRGKHGGPPIASIYQAGGAVRCHLIKNQAMELVVDDYSAILGDAVLGGESSCESAFAEAGRILRISPRAQLSGRAPQTVRWRYEISLTPSAL